MSSYDPRQLKAILEDLQDYLQIWSSVARDTLQLADYAQRLKKEYVARAQHRAAILRNQAQEDEYLVQAKKSQYDSIAAKCTDAVNTAQETLDKCQEVLNNACDTLDVWQSELEEAKAWLERARERREEAQRQYDIATYDVEEAERRLDQAEQDYEECRNDPNRGSCDEEDAEVTSAQDELERARNQLSLAKEELDAAELEIEQARARVECCERAVQFAEDAVEKAQKSLNNAHDAEKNASISVELSDIVQKSANDAEDKANKQSKVSEAIMVTAYESSTLIEEAQRHYAEADHLQEAAQDYVSNANSKINGRIESLVELNRPVLTMETAVKIGGIKPSQIEVLRLRERYKNTIENAINSAEVKERGSLSYRKICGSIGESMHMDANGGSIGLLHDLNETLGNHVRIFDASSPKEITSIKTYITGKDPIGGYTRAFREMLGLVEPQKLDTLAQKLWEIKTKDSTKWWEIQHQLPVKVANANSQQEIRDALVNSSIMRIPSDQVDGVRESIVNSIIKQSNGRLYGIEPTSSSDLLESRTRLLIGKIQPLADGVKSRDLRMLSGDAYKARFKKP